MRTMPHSQFKLSATLSGHEQDVRAIVSSSDSVIVSASRDASVRVWHREGQDWNYNINYKSPDNSFINSLCYLQKHHLIAHAGKDKIINITDPLKDISVSNDEPIFQLVGHVSNVSSLDAQDDLIISGSWDSTAKVWLNNEVKYDLVGHESAVWDVKIINNNEFLTCSADKTIRKWHNDTEVKRYTGHTDAVRKLLLLPHGFASCSNDGTIRIQSYDGELLNTLIGHTSFVYDLNILPNGNFVSSGEDRTVRIWNGNECIQVITFPCISIWCLAILENGDFAVGCSDKNVRVFTLDNSRYASAEDLVKFADDVKNSAINENSLDNLNKEKIPGYEALVNGGGKEGSTKMVKSPAGVIEAYQWTNNNWEKIGDVIGSSGNSEKKTFNGKEWDYVFDVDIQDGAPPLKLPYNTNENVYLAAERFLAANELPNSYLDEVVKFIMDNTSGFTIEQQSANSTAEFYNPYADKRPEKNFIVIPQQELFQFKSYNVDILMKGLTKFNSEQTGDLVLATEELSNIKSYLSNLNLENARIIFGFVELILSQWKRSSEVIGFDLLKVIIDKFSVQPPSNLLTLVKKGLDSPNINVFLLDLKIIINSLDKKWFNDLASAEEFTQLLHKTNSCFLEFGSGTSISEKQLNNLGIVFATLYFDLSTVFLQEKNLDFQRDLLLLINAVADKLVKISSETAYRLIITYANLLYVNYVNPLPSWIKEIKTLYGAEKRFEEIFHDLNTI